MHVDENTLAHITVQSHYATSALSGYLHPVTEEAPVHFENQLPLLKAQSGDDVDENILSLQVAGHIDTVTRRMEIYEMNAIDRLNGGLHMTYFVPRLSRISFKVFIVGTTMKLLEWNHTWSKYVQVRWEGQWEWFDTAYRAE